jgi:hypothetical protein
MTRSARSYRRSTGSLDISLQRCFGHVPGDGVGNGHLATYFHLSRNCPYRQSSLTSYILSHIRIGGFPAGGEDFQAHIPAGLGPFVVLLGQHSADQADDRAAAGEDADHIGAPADLLVQPLLRVAAPDLPPDLAGEGGEGQDVLAGVVEMGGRGRELGLQRGGDLGVPGADRRRVGLLEDGPDQGRSPTAGRSWVPGEQVAVVMELMPTSA